MTKVSLPRRAAKAIAPSGIEDRIGPAGDDTKPGLQFQIGPFTYTVELMDGWPIYEGKKVIALCDFHKQHITVSNRINMTQRVHALFHELRHAWRYYLPVDAQEPELDCDFFGFVCVGIIKDLYGPAGVNALSEMIKSGQSPHTGRANARPVF